MTSPSLTLLHLSDLHFGQGTAGAKYDQLTVVNKILADAKEMADQIGPPDFILITGDIAFSAQKEEYQQAREWIGKLLKKLGLDESKVLVVPGNHDVDRDKIQNDIASQMVHDSLRQNPVKIDEFLANSNSMKVLWPKFESYCKFSQDFRSPKLTTTRPFWKILVKSSLGPVTFAGLNTCLLSFDKKDNHQNLIMGNGQCVQVFEECLEDQLLIVLQHHPPEWLRDGGDLKIRLQSVPHMLICGHTHEQSGHLSLDFNKAGVLKFTAGSAHLSPGEKGRHGFAWIRLSSDGLGFYPRIWEPRKNTFVADSTFYNNMDSEGCVLWEPKDLPELLATWLTARQEGRVTDISPEFDLEPYLSALERETSHIELRGIDIGNTAARYPIEKLFTRLSTRSFEREYFGAWSEDNKQSLAELLPKHNRLFIEGDPGAGKSTFLRLVACMMSRDGLGITTDTGSQFRKTWLGIDPSEPLRTPILVSLSDFAAYLEKAAKEPLDDEHRLLAFRASTWSAGKYNLGPDDWEYLFKNGKAIFLFDGLDEVADPKLRSRVFAIFRNVLEKWKECPVIVTSRPIETGYLHEMGFYYCVIEAFSLGEIEEFIRRWVSVLYSFSNNYSYSLPPDAEDYRQTLLKAITDRATIRRLARNPVMLTCLSVVHWVKRKLPEGRAQVYKAIIKWLLESREEIRKEKGYPQLLAECAFPELAFYMMNHPGGKRTSIELDEAAEVIDEYAQQYFPQFPKKPARKAHVIKWLRNECLFSGIIQKISDNALRFWHLTFQEYLTAELLASMDTQDGTDSFWPIVKKHLSHAQWRETIEMFPGCLLETGTRKVNIYLEKILGLMGENPTPPVEAKVVGIAGKIFRHLKIYDYKPRTAWKIQYEASLKRSMIIFTVNGAQKIPIKDRIAVAEALGQGGDPRLKYPLDNMLSGPDKPHILLCKFPVTVEEYQAFVDDRGYDEPRFWCEGWKFRKNRKWKTPSHWDNQLQYPNRPVVSVSWFEAYAFCQWYSELTGRNIRLPYESEWCNAAINSSGLYPWGSEKPSEELANFAASPGNYNVGSPTPVGVYPSGASVKGHLDLAGNVDEWCLDNEGNELFPTKENNRRSIRGGSWFHYAGNLRSRYRYADGARSRCDNLGFRLACSK